MGDTDAGVMYVVEGFTESGEKFRPSDWMNRVASMAAKYQRGRLIYSEDIYPDVFNNANCLLYNSNLEKKKSCHVSIPEQLYQGT